jgi:tRNA (cytosine49-C5)-methyltransferase
MRKVPAGKELNLKEKFEERYKKLLGDEYESFLKYSAEFIRKAIRVNTLKISVEELKERLEKKGWQLTQVPWCKEGFWIKGERRDLGNLAEHVLGYIYVQEAASMIPAVVLAPKPDEIVLDMCASPGSKTTQMIQYMENKGLVIANDLTGERLKSLAINVQRIGATNTVITRISGDKFPEIKFDRILVDAPCSGTGTIRKSLRTIETWNPDLVKRIAALQKKLIERAFNLLKENGEMVYSTCTLEPEENEEIINFLLEKYPNAKLEEINLDIKRSKVVLEFGGKKYNKEIEKCLRIYPQDNDTEGFFVAKLRKY